MLGSIVSCLNLGHKCPFVEWVVDLVERSGVALVLMIGGFVQGICAEELCLLWVVESYISGLLLYCIAQSPRFTNSQYGIMEIFKCCACASCTIQ